MLVSALLLATALIVPSPAAAPSARLEVSFSAVSERRGRVMLALFDSEAAYRGGKPVRSAVAAADASAVSALLEGLAPGRYAIKAFHDVDGDGRMGLNPFGMPLEPFAFSNNAVGSMGPASWADAAFTVAPGANRHAIAFR